MVTGLAVCILFAKVLSGRSTVVSSYAEDPRRLLSGDSTQFVHLYVTDFSNWPRLEYDPTRDQLSPAYVQISDVRLDHLLDLSGIGSDETSSLHRSISLNGVVGRRIVDAITAELVRLNVVIHPLRQSLLLSRYACLNCTLI
jgi:hypothetical protein